MTTATELLAQWRELTRLEQVLPEWELDQRGDELLRATWEAMVADAAVRESLLAEFQKGDGSDLRQELGRVFLPPSIRAASFPEEYRDHPEVRFDSSVMPIRVALGLPVAEMLLKAPGFSADPLDFTGSWYAGPPVVPRNRLSGWERPRRSDGTPLTHVVQVHLAMELSNQGNELFHETGLPDDGVLQLFHDLETYGWDATDDATAWRLVWLADVLPDQLALAPLDLPAAERLTPINPQVLATVPSVLNLTDATEEEQDRYHRAVDWLERSAYMQNMMAPEVGSQLTPWDLDYVAAQPVSRMGGFAYGPVRPEIQQVLHANLPLAEGDSHALLFDLNPQQFGQPDWFHGARHLEVWMRRSDLDARNFDHSWCVIRTDN